MPYALVSGGQKCTQFHTSTQVHFESSGQKKNQVPKHESAMTSTKNGPNRESDEAIPSQTAIATAPPPKVAETLEETLTR